MPQTTRAPTCLHEHLQALREQIRLLTLSTVKHNEKITAWRTCSCGRCADESRGECCIALEMLEGALHLTACALDRAMYDGSNSE